MTLTTNYKRMCVVIVGLVVVAVIATVYFTSRTSALEDALAPIAAESDSDRSRAAKAISDNYKLTRGNAKK